MKHIATESFWTRYDALPAKIRDLADKNFALLQHNPDHPSLHFKNVSGELWSARVGLHYRALAISRIGGFAWIWIGTHTEYDRILR